MTLQSSGAISLGNVQTEFGGSNPISLSEYYAAASGVPGSGAISLSNFYGKSSVDLVPDALNWVPTFGYYTNNQTIGGISTSINLTFGFSQYAAKNVDATSGIAVYKNGSYVAYIYQKGTGNANYTLSVASGDVIRFDMVFVEEIPGGEENEFGVITTVYNASSSNTVLDTFDLFYS